MQNRKVLNYTLLRLLGKGGMAEVWYAENQIEKPAAVKILNEDLSHNAQIVERFRNEAKITVKLNHPNIRQVYEYDEIDGRPCMVMEYLEGDDLSSRMKHGERFTDEQLEKWWNQLASALNYTHAQGVVHRDIKPSNIFIDREGNVKLLDFGIAKVRDSITATHTGTTMGTLMYMSPEQADDAKHVDGRSDIYSLAVSFVSLMQGHAPYNEQTDSQRAILNHIAEHPLDMTGVPAQWQNFLRPYLAKNPADRPALTEFSAEAGHSGWVPPVDPVVPASEETFVGGGAAASVPSSEETIVENAKASVQDEGTVLETPKETFQEDDAPKEVPQEPKRKHKGLIIVAVLALVAGGVMLALLLGDGWNKRTGVPEKPDAYQAEKEAPAGYVDLGLSVYWAKSNKLNPDDDHGLYTYDDAKRQFGSSLPTKAQMQELVDGCTWTWTGNGYKVTGSNGNSIVLSAEGYRSCGGGVGLMGTDGYYWSSAPDGSGHAYGLYFLNSGFEVLGSPCCYGQSVRLVKPKS